MCRKKDTRSREQIAADYRAKYAGDISKSQVQNSWWWGHMLYSWCNPILAVSRKTDFMQDMHFELRPENKIGHSVTKFQENWALAVKKNAAKILDAEFQIKKPMFLGGVIFKTYRCKILICFMMALIFSVAQYVNTIILYQSLKSLVIFDPKFPGEKREIMNFDIVIISELLGTLVAAKVILSIFQTKLSYELGLMGMEIRNILSSLIMRKALNKSIARDKEFPVGKLLNLVSSDAQKFSLVGQNAIDLTTLPIQIVLGVVILAWLMGNAVYPAIFVTVLIMFFNFTSGKAIRSIGIEIMGIKDRRMKIVNECFNNIEYVKMCASENYFLERICTEKKEELRNIGKIFTRVTWISVLNRLSPNLFLVTLIGFYAWYYDGEGLDVKTVFAAWQTYSTFAGPMGMFPFTAAGFLDMQVSGNRINEFLVSEEVNLKYITWTDNDANDDLAIVVKNGNFFWTDPKKEKFIADKKTYEDAIKKKKCCGAKPKFGEIQDGNSDSTKKSSSSAKKITMKQTITDTKFDKTLAEPLMGSQATEEDPNNDNGSLMLEEKSADTNMPKMNLKDINIQIKKGACIGIIGRVGSGKSSLLTSLFADMYEYDPGTYSTGQGQAREFNGSIATKQQSIYDPESLEDDLYAKPQVRVNGSVSYVSQQTWIQSITLKENILFYAEEDPIRYAEAIRYSAMEPDIEIMADGD